jgi:hypothetical protein
MKSVQDNTGKQYVLLKRSGHASLVRDPATGNECYIQNDRLEHVEHDSTLETAAQTVSEPVRTLLTSVHDEDGLGLLVDLGDRGPLGVRTMLDEYDSCESDLHGRLAVLTAAGLLDETEVGGERGYRLTDDAEAALATIGAGIDRDATVGPESTTDAPGP